MTRPTSVLTEFELARDYFKTKPGPDRKTPPTLPPSWEPYLTERFACLEDSDQPTPSSEHSKAAIPWAPLPGPQSRAYESEADVTGYGGAAGGGKSYLEIGLGVTRHRRSIIFRREAEQTRDLWQKLSEACGQHGRPNENLLVYRDLPGGRYVRLAGCKNPNDWKKYQGQAHDLYCFDEATEFLESQVRTLIAWNRTTVPGQRCRVVLAFNPPTTPEGEWVIQFFAPWLDDTHPSPAEPGELRWYATVDGEEIECADGDPFEHVCPIHDGETIQPRSRTFFPARLEDNPLLEATGYRSQLQGLPEPLRSQMLYGDFTVGMQDDPWQVIPTAWVRAAQARWTPNPPDGAEVSQVGFDVAQGGSDNTVIARRYGSYFADLEVIPGAEVPDAEVNAGHVTRAMVDGGVAWVDADGIGSSTYFLAKATLKQSVKAYQGSAPTQWRDKARVLEFVNTRSAAWWALREALDPASGLNLALPPSRNLRVELCSPKWEKLATGVKIEPKKDIKKRLGRSTDEADAVVMAWWGAERNLVSLPAVRPVIRGSAPLDADRWQEAEHEHQRHDAIVARRYAKLRAKLTGSR